MVFAGESLATYLVPRPVLEALQQLGLSPPQTGICPASGYCYVLQGSQLHIWRYRDGKDARLRTLTLPHAPPPAQPSHVALVAHGADGGAGSGGSGASSGHLSVAVCTADGRLTVWLDANHLSYPVEQQLLTTAPTRLAPAASSSPTRLVTAFSAARLDLGSGPAFLAALGTADGSWYLVHASQQGVVSKQLAAAPAETGGASSRGGIVGLVGSTLSRAYTEVFADPARRTLRKAPSRLPVLDVAMTPVPGGGGQHFRVLLLTAESVDCWLVTAGLRPSEALQWSFLNTTVFATTHREHHVVSASNLAFSCGQQRLAVWLQDDRTGRAVRRGFAVQLLELLPDGSVAPVAGLKEHVEGYREPARPPHLGLSLRRQLLYVAGHSTCLLADWASPATAAQQQQQLRFLDGSGGSGGGSCSLWCWSATGINGGKASSISEDPDTLAVALAGSEPGPGGSGAGSVPRWVVLNATYGVVEVAAVPGAGLGVDAVATAAALGGGASLDPSATVSHLLDALLSQAAAIAAAGSSLLPLLAGLERRLSALGALGSAVVQLDTIARYSSQLIDMLPKQWAAAAEQQHQNGGDDAAALAVAARVSLSEALAEKEARHGLLLQCLAEGGIMPMLAPAVQRVLMEDSEKLAVASALLRQYLQLHDVAAGGGLEAPAAGPVAGSSSTSALALLGGLVAEAGQATIGGGASYEVLSPSEVFYSRPSASVPQWLAALGRAAAGCMQQAAGGLAKQGDRGIGELRAAVSELAAFLALAMGAVSGRRDMLQRGCRLSAADVAARLGSPNWLAGPDARAAMEALAGAIQAVRPHPSPAAEPPLDAAQLPRCLMAVSDVLLAAYSAALAAAAAAAASAGAGGSGGAPSALVAAYRATRERCCDELLEEALVEVARARAAGAPLGADFLIWPLEQLARAHHCYRQLFDICEALAAADPDTYGSRLHTYMAIMPPEDLTGLGGGDAGGGAGGGTVSAPTLAQYVYGRLLQEGRAADLLELPQPFHAGITAFLQSYPQLLWLHLLRAGDSAQAAAVLLSQHQQQQQGAPSAAAAGDGPWAGPLGAPLRLLSLARLAARAGGDQRQEATAELQLRLLGIQERVGLGSGGGSGTAVEGLLEPGVLLERALAVAVTAAQDPARRAEAAVAAVEILATVPAEAFRAHASKWQVAWRACFDADPWADLEAERRGAGGAAAGGGGGAGALAALAGGGWAAALASTAVCRAAQACAGSAVLGAGESVQDTEPLEQVSGWLRGWALQAPGGGEARADIVASALQLGLSQLQQQQAPGRGAAGDDMMVL